MRIHRSCPFKGVLTLACSMALPASAERFAYEGFDYAEPDGTSISGLNGGTGWDEAFPTVSGMSLQPGLAYTGLSPVGKSMGWTAGSSTSQGRDWGGLNPTTAPANGTYWFSVLVDSTGTSEGNFNWMYATNSANGQNGVGFRTSRASGFLNFVPIHPNTDGTGGPQAGTTTPGTPALIVGRLNLSVGTDSPFRIWVNPSTDPNVVPQDSDANSALATVLAAQTGNLRASISGRAFGGRTGFMLYDEIRIGSSFAEVLPSTGAELAINPASAIENQTLTFNWSNVPGTATAIELDPGDIDLLGLTTAGAGSTTLPAPAANTTYTLTYTVGGTPTSVDEEFTAIAPSFTMPDTGYLGDTLTVNWQVPVGSTAVTLNPGAIDLSGLTSGTDGTGTTTIPAPSADTTYTLSYTSGGNPFSDDEEFTLLPSFLSASPDVIIAEVAPITLSWRIDPAYNLEADPSVTLEIGPLGGPYFPLDATFDTEPADGSGSLTLTPLPGEVEYRLLYNLGGVQQVLTDIITIYPKVFELGITVNNTRPVQSNPLPMFDGVTAYSDRGHVWAAVPSILQGAQFVKFGQDDKATPNLEVSFTSETDATFFLLLDNRIGDNVGGNNPAAGTDSPPLLPNSANSMAWVLASGFVDSGVDIGLDESPSGPTSIDQSYSVYFRQVAQGETFTFFQQNDTSTGGPGGRNMYGIAGVSPQVTPVAFVANPAVILSGAGSTLQWTVPVGSTVTIDQGIGDVSSATDAGTGVGSLPVNPSATTSYTLTYDPPGAGTPPVSLAPFTVTVNQFTATPAVITAGESSTLDVQVPAGSSGVTINPGGIPVAIDGSGAGSVVVSPTANTTYTLVYTAPAATTPTTAGTTSVTVTPATPFVITGVSVASNGDVSFSWPAPAGVTDPLLLTDTVERSTNLSAWADITGSGAFSIVNGVASFTDTDPPAGGKAFYRIVRP